MAAKTVGILALQGAFREHGNALKGLGANVVEIRQPKHLAGLDGVILPGGESTTIGKLLVDLKIMAPLQDLVTTGMPVFGTCAGMILLCDRIENATQPGIGGLDATARRNAFGRQAESFETPLVINGLDPTPFPAVFIRAPILLETGPQTQTLASLLMDGQERPVAVRQRNILACSFHPELTPDARMHSYFLKMINT